MDEIEDCLSHTTKCSCGHDVDHLVKFQYYREKAEWGGNYMVIYTGLNHFLPVWKRIIVAVKYILGIDNTYCTFTESMLDASEVERLKDYLNSCFSTGG